MKATEWLKRDHELIIDAILALDAAATWVQAGGCVPQDRMQRLVRFFHEFADKYHHYKEEEVLFPALLEAGMPPAGPVSVMLREHEHGRALLQQIEGALPELAVEPALDYVAHLSLHIRKENEILFHMADRMLAGRDEQLVAQMMEKTKGIRAQVLAQDEYRRTFADILVACAA